MNLSTMDYQEFYLTTVYPQLEFRIVNKYPLVSLGQKDSHQPLSRMPVLMLVALTGTGKTTTLNALSDIAENNIEQGMSVIPSRREIADWIAIPTAQVILDEPIQPVTDRVQRFHYTRTFADHVNGGMATAFSWVHVSRAYNGLIISEGIRGANEISHALTNFPNWHIIELALHPLTRLQRLSDRSSAFDNADGEGDVTFLPADLQAEANALVASGDITAKALTITQAESQSYGLYPFADGHNYNNYHRVDVDDKIPDQVARDVHTIMKGLTHAND